MNLYSYQGREPKELPSSIALDESLTESGLKETRTSLDELSPEELQRYGFTGPFTKPFFDEYTQKITWDGSQYLIENLTEEEKQQVILEKEKSANDQTLESETFRNLFSRFKQSGLYKRIKEDSLVNLESNIIFTQIYSSLSAAETGKVNNGEIQSWINAIYFKYNLTTEEKSNFLDILTSLNLDHRYDIPSEDILATYDFDFITNTIKEPAPYPSWTWSGEKWNPPVEYPNDGLSYVWNEETKSWDLGDYMSA